MLFLKDNMFWYFCLFSIFFLLESKSLVTGNGPYGAFISIRHGFEISLSTAAAGNIPVSTSSSGQTNFKAVTN